MGAIKENFGLWALNRRYKQALIPPITLPIYQAPSGTASIRFTSSRLPPLPPPHMVEHKLLMRTFVRISLPPVGSPLAHDERPSRTARLVRRGRRDVEGRRFDWRSCHSAIPPRFARAIARWLRQFTLFGAVVEDTAVDEVVLASGASLFRASRGFSSWVDRTRLRRKGTAIMVEIMPP